MVLQVDSAASQPEQWAVRSFGEVKPVSPPPGETLFIKCAPLVFPWAHWSRLDRARTASGKPADRQRQEPAAKCEHRELNALVAYRASNGRRLVTSKWKPPWRGLRGPRGPTKPDGNPDQSSPLRRGAPESLPHVSRAPGKASARSRNEGRAAQQRRTKVKPESGRQRDSQGDDRSLAA